jgi:hypothetical protein
MIIQTKINPDTLTIQGTEKTSLENCLVIWELREILSSGAVHITVKNVVCNFVINREEIKQITSIDLLKNGWTLETELGVYNSVIEILGVTINFETRIIKVY